MKNKLMKMLKAKNERKAELVRQSEKSESIEELRSINTELDNVNEELRSVQAMIDELEEDEGGEGESQRTQIVNAATPGMVTAPMAATQQRTADADEMEYRKAFQQFVTRGTPIPEELRVDANTLTTDVGSAIPTTVINRIVEKLETVGVILPLITRTQFASGVVIPTSSVKPVATWVSESASSDRQKKTTGTITFGRFKLRCEISMSAEVGALAVSAFESAFVRQVTEAMVKAIETAIVSTADGTTSPKGILAETPVTGQALQYVSLSYNTLVEAEAALPAAYEPGALWCMTKKTFMGFIGMTDTDGHPIARVNYGLGGKPERMLLGRNVVLCDYIDSFATDLTDGKVFAFIFNFEDYALNTVYDMGIQRKQDWDTEDYLTKAVMSVDGKVVDKNSLVTLAKKS